VKEEICTCAENARYSIFSHPLIPRRRNTARESTNILPTPATSTTPTCRLSPRRQVSDECGNPLYGKGASWTFEYYAGEKVVNDVYSVPGSQKKETEYPYQKGTRLQADMYMCAPWGNYELTLKTKSTNGGYPMEYVAWEVEYGPDQVSRVLAVPCHVMPRHAARRNET